MSAPDDQQAQLLYPPHVIENTATLSGIRFLTSCATGAVAGILGLTNQYGFALFICSSLLTTTAVYAVHIAGRGGRTAGPRGKGGPIVNSFVRGGLWDLVNPGQENVFSFVLLWTLFYGIVHVYD